MEITFNSNSLFFVLRIWVSWRKWNKGPNNFTDSGRSLALVGLIHFPSLDLSSLQTLTGSPAVEQWSQMRLSCFGIQILDVWPGLHPVNRVTPILNNPITFPHSGWSKLSLVLEVWGLTWDWASSWVWRQLYTLEAAAASSQTSRGPWNQGFPDILRTTFHKDETISEPPDLAWIVFVGRVTWIQCTMSMRRFEIGIKSSTLWQFISPWKKIYIWKKLGKILKNLLGGNYSRNPHKRTIFFISCILSR